MITLTPVIFGIVKTVLIFTLIGAILGLLIGVAAKFLHVEVDDRVERIQSLLPGANCGGCGFPGCSGLAESIVHDGISPTNCKSIKLENVEEIKKILNENK